MLHWWPVGSQDAVRQVADHHQYKARRGEAGPWRELAGERLLLSHPDLGPRRMRLTRGTASQNAALQVRLRRCRIDRPRHGRRVGVDSVVDRARGEVGTSRVRPSGGDLTTEAAVSEVLLTHNRVPRCLLETRPRLWALGGERARGEEERAERKQRCLEHVGSVCVAQTMGDRMQSE
jgi:hypothetical protein